METQPSADSAQDDRSTTPLHVVAFNADAPLPLHSTSARMQALKCPGAERHIRAEGPEEAALAPGETLNAASVLAHELSQPFAAIVNYVEACRRTLAPWRGLVPETAFDCMDKAISESARAGRMIRHLRCLFERRAGRRSSTSINDIITRACTRLASEVGEQRIDLKLALDPRAPCAVIDRVQIELVMVNLMRNGIEALQDSAERRLTVSTATTTDHSIVVSIADSGPGLPTKVAKRLFQPVDSHKPRGMGIGLTICYAVVSAHGGRIWGQSQLGKGTVFHFTLPIGDTAMRGAAVNG